MIDRCSVPFKILFFLCFEEVIMVQSRWRQIVVCQTREKLSPFSIPPVLNNSSNILNLNEYPW